MKACTQCGAIAEPGTTRCARHQIARMHNTRKHRTLAREVVAHAIANDVPCHICGEHPWADDPFEADHIVPLALGGHTIRENLAPAHRSCNRRRGAAITNGGVS